MPLSFNKTFLICFTVFTFFFYFYALKEGACSVQSEKYSCPLDHVMHNITHCKYYKYIIQEKIHPETGRAVYVGERIELFGPSIKAMIFVSFHPMFLAFVVYLTFSMYYYIFSTVPFKGSGYFYPIIAPSIPFFSLAFSSFLFPLCETSL